MTAAGVGPAAPFFIVSDLTRALAHYEGALGFERRFAAPPEAPFFAIVGRGAAQIFLKEVSAAPRPNPTVHEEARWDAFIHAAAPDALAAEITARGVALHRPLAEGSDGLLGFEVADPDGYVCFFGRPRG